MTEITIAVEDNGFRLSLTEGAVILHNSDSLESFLKTNSWDHALMLARKIRSAYAANLSKELDITEQSIAVEILGHVYFENFMEVVGNKIPLKVMDSICAKISSHCREINIGEKEHDHNRRFWDLVTPVVKGYFK